MSGFGYFSVPPNEPHLTKEEIETLPSNVARYIEHLQKELAALRFENDKQKNQIRRTNWGRSR
jgi:hypothetical protein